MLQKLRSLVQRSRLSERTEFWIQQATIARMEARKYRQLLDKVHNLDHMDTRHAEKLSAMKAAAAEITSSWDRWHAEEAEAGRKYADN